MMKTRCEKQRDEQCFIKNADLSLYITEPMANVRYISEKKTSNEN